MQWPPRTLRTGRSWLYLFELVIQTALLLLLVHVIPANAALVDQRFEPDSFSTFTQFNARRVAQSFTAGVSGQLSAIDLYVSQLDPTGNLVVEIMPKLVAGEITTPFSILGSVAVPLHTLPSSRPGGTGPAFVKVDLSALNISIEAETEYAVVLHRDYGDDGGSFGVVWIGGTPDQTNSYTRGNAFGFQRAGFYTVRTMVNGLDFYESVYMPDRWLGGTDAIDFGFRTYVVPEPSSLAISGVGAFGLLAFVFGRRMSTGC